MQLVSALLPDKYFQRRFGGCDNEYKEIHIQPKFVFKYIVFCRLFDT